MVSQTLISFKCDSVQLRLLDETCAKLGIKRNNLLNFLVSYANSNFQDIEKYRFILSYASALKEFT